MDSAPENHTQAGSLRRHAQKAVFAPLALLVFGGAVLLLILIMQISRFFPLGPATCFVPQSLGVSSILSAVFGISGLSRHELPRRPAFMAVGSILIRILMLCGAFVSHPAK